MANNTAANNTFSCPVFPPETSACTNGRGVCVGPNTCQCPAPWSGYGDFVVGTQSCDINLDVIMILWSIATVFLAGEAIAGLNLVKYGIVRAYNRMAVSGTTTTRIRSFFHHLWLSPTFVPGFGAFLAGVSLGTLAISRATTLLQGIGNGALPSWAFFIGTVAYWILATSFIFQYIAMATHGLKLRQDSQSLSRRTRMLKLFGLPAVWASAFMAGVASLPMMSDPAHMREYATMHYAFISVTCFIFCGVIIPCLTYPMLQELKATRKFFSDQNGVDTSTLIEVTKKVTWLQQQCMINGLMQSALCSTLAAWPFLQRKASYFHALAWIQGGIVGIIVAWSLIPSREKKSSSRGPTSEHKNSREAVDHSGSSASRSNRNNTKLSPLASGGGDIIGSGRSYDGI